MNVNGIRFEGESPTEIDVTITLSEAVLIADYVGKLTPSSLDTHGIWEALTGMVFNCYWEDGLDGAKRDVR